MDTEEIDMIIYERMLVKYTSATESLGARMNEFVIEYGSGRNGAFRREN